MGLIKRLVFSTRTRGIWQTLFWARFGLLHLNKFILYEINLKNLGTLSNESENLRLERVPLDRLIAIRKNRKSVPLEFYADKIDGVKECYFGYFNEDVAYLHWVYRPSDRSRFFELSDGQIEINNYITFPHYREMGFAVSALKQAIAIHREEGLSSIFSGVHSENLPSQKCLLRAGFVAIGQIKHYGPYRPRLPTSRIISPVSEKQSCSHSVNPR